MSTLLHLTFCSSSYLQEHLVLGLIAQIIKVQLLSLVKADVSAELVKELAEEVC